MNNPFKKINFKQHKYILPLLILVPLVFLLYTTKDFYETSEDDKDSITADSLMTDLPEAEGTVGKDFRVSTRGIGGSSSRYTAIEGIGKDEEEEDFTAGDEYSENEKRNIDSINMLAEKQRQDLERFRQQLQLAQEHVNEFKLDNNGNIMLDANGRPIRKNTTGQRSSTGGSYAAGQGSQAASAMGGSAKDPAEQEYEREMEAIRKRAEMTRKILTGEDEQEKKEKLQQQMMEETMKRQAEKKDTVVAVEKIPEQNRQFFNTLGEKEEQDEEKRLITAMVDMTTKVKDGSRLRLKLLDDISIGGIPLKKGEYLYAMVNGFKGQRVMASVESVLIRGKFVKIHLDLYDNDGIEGFYVPASAFRDFIKDVGGEAVSPQMNINTMGGQFDVESMGLQTLQDILRSGGQAIKSNIRRNKAKIKYNTQVYLVDMSAIKNDKNRK